MLSKRLKQNQDKKKKRLNITPKLGRPSPAKRRTVKGSPSESSPKNQNSQQNINNNETNSSTKPNDIIDPNTSLQQTQQSINDETNNNNNINNNEIETDIQDKYNDSLPQPSPPQLISEIVQNENLETFSNDTKDNNNNNNKQYQKQLINNNNNTENNDLENDNTNNNNEPSMNNSLINDIDEFEKAAEATESFTGYAQLLGNTKTLNDSTNHIETQQSSSSSLSAVSASSNITENISMSPQQKQKRTRNELEISQDLIPPQKKQRNTTDKSSPASNNDYSASTRIRTPTQQNRKRRNRLTNFSVPENPTLGDYAREALATVPEGLQKLREKRKKRLEELRKRREQMNSLYNNNNNKDDNDNDGNNNNRQQKDHSIEEVVEILERGANTEENERLSSSNLNRNQNDNTREEKEEEKEEEEELLLRKTSDQTPMFRFENGQIIFNGGMEQEGERDAEQVMAQYSNQEAVEESELPHFTSYTNMRRKNPTKKWNREENDLFFKAIRQYGTDFSLIERLFPLRNRRQIRNKFKKEERDNPDKVDWALSHRLPVDEDQYHRLNAEKTEKEKEKRRKQGKDTHSSSSSSEVGVTTAASSSASMSHLKDSSGEMTVDELASMFGEPVEEEDDDEEDKDKDNNKGKSKNDIIKKHGDDKVEEDEDEWDTVETDDVIETGFKHGDEDNLEFNEEDLTPSHNFQETLDWL